MSKYSINIVHKPVLGPEQVITRADMQLKLSGLPIRWDKVKLTDLYFYCPDWEGWRKAIEYLQARLPKYYESKFDCENFAGWFRHKMAEEFQINTCAEVEGFADCRGLGMERHSWTVFTEGKFFYQMETQTGVIMDIDDPLYVPDEIVMG